eukprot:m.72310 g.72310  ORF g.72310 m.72310 type:complete len:564 (-) comp14250_c0_seq1:102-1793(-)
MATDHSEFDPLAAFSSPAAAYPAPNANSNNAPGLTADAFDPFGSFAEAPAESTPNSNDNINAANVNQRPANANSTSSSVAISPSAAAPLDPFADLYSSSRANNQAPTSNDGASASQQTTSTPSPILADSEVSPTGGAASVAAEVDATPVVNYGADTGEASTVSTSSQQGQDSVASQQGQFNFQAFLAKMRQQKAFDLVKQIKSFIGKFSTPVLNPDEAAPLIRRFLDSMCTEVERHELWQQADEATLDNAFEGLEKYVLSKIHRYIFKPEGSDDALQNQALSDRMTMLSFIKPEHLDVSALVLNHADKLAEAQTELIKMDSYKSPRDKIICILNCARVLMAVLTSTEDASGADEFLPLLIYVILQAQPPNLHCNLMYITRFRDPDKLMGEAGYYLTNMQGAVSFIQTVTAAQLSIDPDEFDRHLNQTLESMYAQAPPSTAPQTAPLAANPPVDDKHKPTRPPPPRPVASPALDSGDVRVRADTLSTTVAAAAAPPTSTSADDSFNVAALVEGAAQRPISRFLQCADAADLRLGDVQVLLQDYQRLSKVNDELIRTVNLNLAMN